MALAEELVAAGYRVMFAGANVALKAEVDAAVAAVRQWRFKPARRADGQPVRVLFTVTIRFALQ